MAGVHDGHRRRLKERLIKEGLDGFAPHNVMELLLFFAIPQKDTNELAHTLIDQFGSFSGALDASMEDLCSIKGVGANTAILLKLIPAISRYYLNDSSKPGTALVNAEQISSYLLPKFVGRTTEQVYLLCLNNKGNVVFGDFVFEGVLNAALIDIRRILETALRCRAASVILAHNHPHGFVLPSNADVTATKSISSALATANIHLVDHFIFAGNEYLSMREAGHLNFV